MEGYYSTGGASACTACQVGYYCTDGVRYECQHLYYADETGLSECKPVPRHYVSNAIIGASSISECGINQYTDYMQQTCYTCDDAHQCFKTDEVKPCPYGFAKLGGNWYCSPCPPGYICEISTTAGSTSATTIASYESGLSTTEKNYPRHSAVGELAPKICPPNNQCNDDGLNYFICPHGTFPYITGCAKCPSDKFCMTSYNRQVTVSTGSVSDEGDSFPRFQPQGYTWGGNAAGWSTTPDFTAQKTAKGRISEQAAGSKGTLQYDCPQGYSCTHTSAARCPSSHLGKLVGGENIGTISETQEILHNYESLSGFTYTNLSDSLIDSNYHQCIPCNGGYSCTLGSDPSACAAGKYSPPGDYECYTCPPGHYCAAKSFYPTKCGTNKYNDQAGQTSSAACTACPTGYYAGEGSSICEPCPGGYECSTGTPTLCPVGKYSAEGEASCSACQDGYICDKGSKSRSPPENLCPKGSYCKDTGSGFTLQYKCPQGTYGLGEGARAATE